MVKLAKLKKVITWIRQFFIKPEPRFDPWRDTVVERYPGAVKCGYWGALRQTENGEWEPIPDTGGKMFSQRIKYRTPEGKMGLDNDWVADSDADAWKL